MASEKVGASLELISMGYYCMYRDNLPGDDHEFLEGKTATGVRATVEDVLDCIVSNHPWYSDVKLLTGYGENVGLLGASQVGDVCVERDTLLGGSGLCDGH
jgi:hypothetical protein